MKHYLASLFLLLSYTIMAQDDFLLSLKDEKFQNPLPHHYIEQIIDARKEKSNIGLIHRFLLNRKESLNFSSSIEKEIAQFLSSEMGIKKGKKALLLRINEFLIEEVKGERWARITVNMTFIEKQNDEYSELFTANNVNVYDLSSQIRKPFYQEYLAKALTVSFADFAIRFNFAKLHPQKIDKKAIYTYSPPTEYAIQKVKTPKKGIFHSYYDFIENTPDTSIDVSKDKKILRVKSKNIVAIQLDTKKLGFFPWGISTGHGVLILHENLYYPLQKHDKEWFFYAKPTLNSFAWHTPNALQYSKEEILYRFVLDKGIFEFYPKDIPKTVMTAVHIFNSTFSVNKNMDIFINETKIVTLPASTHAIIEMEKIPVNATLCIQVEGEAKICQEISLNLGKHNYFLAKAKKNKPITLENILDKAEILDLKRGANNNTYELICMCFYYED